MKAIKQPFYIEGFKVFPALFLMTIPLAGGILQER